MSPAEIAAALRLAEILDRTQPMPLPSEVYRPETGADWAFQITTLDAMARLVGPLAREVQSWQQMQVCEEHGRPIYHEGVDCPACHEAELLRRLDDRAYSPDPCRSPARPVALRHAWRPAPGRLDGNSCLHCGVMEGAAAPEFCASRLALQ